MGSSLDLSCLIVHDGVMRRSEEEAVEVIRRGRSFDAVMGVCMLTGAPFGSVLWIVVSDRLR